MEGNELDLYDFEEDDVVAIIADNDRIRDYIDYIKIVKLDRSVVRGTIEGTFTSNGNSYVIIDDDDDMLDKQLNHFVQTNAYKRGLSDEDVEKAIKILNNGN